MLVRLLKSSLGLLGLSIAAVAAPIPFPSGFVPFTSIYYIAGPDAAGNRLVEGNLDFTYNAFGTLQSITPGTANQQFSDAFIQLAPGQYFSNVFVPTAAELTGDFRAVPFPIFDPLTGNLAAGTGMLPFFGNIIPASKLINGIFAFEIGASVVATPEPNAATMLAMAVTVFGIGALARKQRKFTIARPN